ncbi:MAG: SAM-dependent methyltransferase [Lachnospiraceae bacterium]|nr:SAM-dependent methyltransferase [Lachnospiraceae bacterium]
MSEELRQLLQETINRNLYQIIISNSRDKEKAFKVKIRPIMLKDEILYQETIYQGTKVFHENYRDSEMIQRVEKYLENDFKQCEIEHTIKKAVILVSKKGKMTIKTKQTKQSGQEESKIKVSLAHNRVKKYILEEGIPVPFLIDLGVQSKDGKIIRAKYDKYKQINRFLEFVEDILPALSKDREIKIVDFGCGKSYLTFAIYYYLHELKGFDAAIIGLDLKEDVIAHCNELSQKYGYTKLQFIRGDIAEYEGLTQADMVVTLHACDTATDYALEKAVKWDAKVILSVPCCQHEVNKQIQCETLQPVLQYGIVKERMSALLTDALRADILKAVGYEADLLEFIDLEHTPKNILIRAVKKEKQNIDKQQEEMEKVNEMMKFMQIEPTLYKLLNVQACEGGTEGK